MTQQYPEKLRHWLSTLVSSLQASGYYGRLEVVFRDGEIVHLEERRSIKPPEDSDGNQRQKRSVPRDGAEN